MMVSNMTKEDKKWQAENDARTLMNAIDIQSQKTRYNAALREVKNIQKEAQMTVQKAGKLANKATTKRTPKGKKPVRKRK